MGDHLSRRDFLQPAAVPVVAAGAPGSELPKQAWVIIVLGWEYNDKYAYPEGEYVQPKLYFDKSQAEAECGRLCDAFFAAETPQEFGVDHMLYLGELPDDVDEDSITWEQLRAAGFPHPYYIQQMET